MRIKPYYLAISTILLMLASGILLSQEYYWYRATGTVNPGISASSPGALCEKLRPMINQQLQSTYPDYGPTLGSVNITIDSVNNPPVGGRCNFSGSGLPWEPEIYANPYISLRGSGCSGGDGPRGGVCEDPDDGPPECDDCCCSGNPISTLTGQKY